jgi:hypothetical protein
MKPVSALRVKIRCGYGTWIVRGTQEGERPPLEAGTRRLVRDSRVRGHSACMMNCRV